MTARLIATFALILLSGTTGTMAQDVTTPQEVCATFPAAAQADCLAAGELLLMPGPAENADLSLLLRAGSGALTAELTHMSDGSSFSCTVERALVLPAETTIAVSVTAIDDLYRFEIPGLLPPVDLVPGRINETQMTTPEQPGPIEAMLDSEGAADPQIYQVHFVSGGAAAHFDNLCGGQP